MHIDNFSDLNQQMLKIAQETNTTVKEHQLALVQGRMRSGDLTYFIKLTNTRTSPVSIHNILITDSLATELIVKSKRNLTPISH